MLVRGVDVCPLSLYLLWLLIFRLKKRENFELILFPSHVCPYSSIILTSGFVFSLPIRVSNLDHFE